MIINEKYLPAIDAAMSLNESDLATFTAAYETALYWSSSDTVDGQDVTLDDYPTSTAADDKSRADCRAFFTANRADIYAAAYAYRGREEHGGLELAGHDFALTRNNHGAGYWDGDLPEELGQRLTKAAEAAGPVEAYIGDDGLIYQA